MSANDPVATSKRSAFLLELGATLAALFDSLDDCVCVVERVPGELPASHGYRYVAVNRAMQALFGDEGPGGSFGTDEFQDWYSVYDQVLDTRRSLRIERKLASLGLAAELFISYIDDGSGQRLLVVIRDVTQRKLMDAALRYSEDRQAFLLELSDALRGLANPHEVKQQATARLARQLGILRTSYLEVDAAHDDRPRTYGFALAIDAAYRAGRTVTVANTETDQRFQQLRRAYRAIGVQAWAGVPLIVGGHLVAVLSAQDSAPRVWKPSEVRLMEEVARRTWEAVERARTEAALRASEARFRQFAEASSDVLWIRDARTLEMQFLSPAFNRIYGIDRRDLVGAGVQPWAALIVPEDRAGALEKLAEAVRGRSVVHEFRIMRGFDGAFRWIGNTDFPLHDERGRVQHVAGIATDVTESRLATEHQAILLAELQHRVRNIMALVQAIAAQSRTSAVSVQEYAALTAGRLRALARVQVVLTRATNVGVPISDVVRAELSAQAHGEEQYEISGPQVQLSPKATEVLTLAIHELATNAVKYGALSSPQGRVTVQWNTFSRGAVSWVGLDWTESGGPAQPARTTSPIRRGFGTKLIEERIPYELHGRGTLTIGDDGARCHLEFPLDARGTILDTSAPRSAKVFGGETDARGQANLAGHQILVVEDDYYLASDTARLLMSAGAEVLGPCADEASARMEIAHHAPTGAVIDIDLGSGPSFELTQQLRRSGIPVVMMTGYDDNAIPTEYADLPRLQKPVDFRQLVIAVVAALSRQHVLPADIDIDQE